MEQTQKSLGVILHGGNYLLWARTTKTVLCGRGLWSHITSTQAPKEAVEAAPTDEATPTKEPAKTSEEDKWFQEDQSVLSLLQNSLETSVLEGYSFCETAKELWDTLKKVYGNESNLTRVYEVKKAINNISQEDLEFTKHFGRFSSLWSELEGLRPSTLDPKVLKERREQDKVFGLLLTLNPGYNDLIKHILRSDKFPTIDEVCAQIQKEQGSSDLFGGKGELAMANKGEVTMGSANKSFYKQDDKKSLVCDHCKRRGHIKDKCWLLHPHLKPAKFKEARAHLSRDTNDDLGKASTSRTEGGEIASNVSGEFIRKSDLEAFFKSLTTLKESGTTLFSQHLNKTLVIDSGASHHMISNPSLLNDIQPCLGNVEVANGERVPIKGIGNLNLFNKHSKALFMPKFTSNLLSVKRATNDLNCLAIFGPNNVHFQDIDTGKVIGEGGSKGDLYVLEDYSPSLSSSFSFKSCLGKSLNEVWHARLGHPHNRALELMLPNVYFDSSRCEACILGKHCKIVFPNSKTLYENCFDLVHSDVWTSPCLSRDKYKYFVTFIDEKSKYTWLTLLPSKDRVFDAFVKFEQYVTNQFNAKIKVLRSDNGGEYTSQIFKDHLSKHGIVHQTSCPYTPQQNGVAERKNRHLMEVARSMMFHTNVPKKFWGDAVTTACYLINRTPTKVLKDVSPYEVLNGNKPSLDHLRIFGCVCFVLVPGDQRNKLDAKSIRCVFLGYSTTQKGYKCFDPERLRTLVSRDVKFIEDQGYFVDKDWESLKNLADTKGDRSSSLRYILEHLGNETGGAPQQMVNNQHEGLDHPTTTPLSQNSPSQTLGRASQRTSSHEDSSNSPSNPSRDDTFGSFSETRQPLVNGTGSGRASGTGQGTTSGTGHGTTSGTRHGTTSGTSSGMSGDTSSSGNTTKDTSDHTFHGTSDSSTSGTNTTSRETTGANTTSRETTGANQLRRSERLQQRTSTRDETSSTLAPIQPCPTSRTSGRTQHQARKVYFNSESVAHPIQAVCSLAHVPTDHQAFINKISLHTIPQSYEEAMETKEWRDAVHDEIEAMKRNHTWDEDKLPVSKTKRPVSSKWIFTIKYKSNGDIERYKARLVARGFTQTYGEDYTDTFAPVAKLHTVRVILSIATNLSWDLWQMDVKNAFLQGELEEDVYMTPPPGLETTVAPGNVLRLRKAIYGLKQSPRAWYHKLSRTLKDHGFLKSESDHTLFTRRTTNGIVVVLIYVDDLIISGDDKDGISETKTFLKSTFDIKDLGTLKYFLGIEVCRSLDGLFLSQRKYVCDLLKESGFLDAKPTMTPLPAGYKVYREGEQADEPFRDPALYRRLVGKLIYLTITRPDLCFAVNQVSQYMQKPTVYHWEILEHVLRYVKGSSGQGIWMGRNSSTEVVGYCDADWGGDRSDRKSITGYCTFIGGNLVTWKTKKQKVVSCSSAESEYRAMKKLTNELTWLKALLKDLGIDQEAPMTMHCDNKAAIYIASNSVFHERTKHIEIDCHKVRQKIEEGVTLPCFTPSEDQLADIFTKAASSQVCTWIHGKLGLMDLHYP